MLLLLASTGSAASADEPLEPLAPRSTTHTRAQIELGRLLFFDGRLSGDASTSCASCHDPEAGWADGKALSNGYPGSLYFRNTPTVLNASRVRAFFWDGRLDGADVPTMVRDHISEAHFMNADGRLILERLRQIPHYERAFSSAFGGEVSYGGILNAVAAYLSSLEPRNVPFDRFLRGDRSALSPFARRGYELFAGKAGCVRCHSGSLLSDGDFHRLGVPENPAVFAEPERHITFRRYLRTLGISEYVQERSDRGRSIISKRAEDGGRFRTPSLREVSRTAPYMHNGVLASLEDVVAFYNRGGGERSELQPLDLSDNDQADLVAFLESLAGERIEIDWDEVASPPYAARRLGEN